jgi:hypothetical protein
LSTVAISGFRLVRLPRVWNNSERRVPKSVRVGMPGVTQAELSLGAASSEADVDAPVVPLC